MDLKERLSSRSQVIGPKVYKNKRLDEKWGTEYHTAIQEIVFGRQCPPYIPSEPPIFMNEDSIEIGPLYECKQCRDGFRFESSFEEHKNRHSWILGLWCHRCFDTICTHLNKDTSMVNIKCFKCLQEVTEKRAYLRAKSIHRHQRWGAIRVFYNQCQFIEHMKMHRLSTVNMADLILMPLPVEMSDSDWSSDFEILCEALMEQAFLSRKHIIDWLKAHELQDNWWKLVNGKSDINYISEVVANYEGRQLFKTYDLSMMDTKSNSNIRSANNNSPNIDIIDNSSMDQDTNSSVTTTSDKGAVENEDNPCTSTDITFVDCGPTSLHLQPEISEGYTHKEQKTIQKTKTCHAANTEKIININKDAFKDYLHETKTYEKKADDSSSYKNLVIEKYLKDAQQSKTVQCVVKKIAENNSSKTNISKNSCNFVKTVNPFPPNKNRITKIDVHSFESNLSTAKASNNSKVLTVQDSKNIAAIISQLPPELLSNTKVLVIPQKLCNISRSENDANIKKDLNISVANNGGIGSNTLTQKTCDSNVKKEEITKKVMIKDGKKYIIKCKNTKDSSSSNLSVVRNPIKTIKPSFDSSILKTMIIATNLKESKNTSLKQANLFNKNVSIASPSTSLSIPPLVTSSFATSLSTPSPSSKLSNNSIQSGDESHAKETSNMPKLQKAPPHLISIYPVQNYIFETISLINNDKGELCMDVKTIERIARESYRDICDVIIKYKREMFDEFYEMNSLELKKRIDHLKEISIEVKQVLNFIPNNVFREKIKAVKVVQSILDDCLKKYQNVLIERRDDNDPILNEWEVKVDLTQKCFLCRKLMKPKSYIPGFSKRPKIDVYCLCYKNVCHECTSCQEHIAQFIAHQNIHKMTKPHVCPDCNLKFYDAVSLEVHLWSVCFHTLKKVIFTCKICEIDGFKDLESVTRHFVIMHSETKIGCEDCLRVLLSYNEYIQHCKEMHSSKIVYKPTRIVICKLSNVALRWENYITYLEKYPAIRKVLWFKCPFCNLMTTDNKHVMTLLNNHLRNEHMERMSEILSEEAFTKIFGTSVLRKPKVEEGNVSYAKLLCTTTDDTVPKIVSTRTISSETFEHGSQVADSMWSTNANIVDEENPQTMKKIDDKEKKEILPKIINVTSINDLKLASYISKETITQLNETKKKSSFPSLQLVENEAKNLNLSACKETPMENDDKSNTNEETTKTKELDGDNNESTMNAVYISNLEKPLLDTIRVNLPITSDKTDSNSTSEESTNNRIKIVDFRKICKPDIEQFVITKMFNIQMKDENASMINPPPLVKYPNYLLEPIEINELESKPVSNLEKSNFLFQKIPDESKMRICIGTDTQEEGIDYLCHLCKEPINTSSFVVQTHFREKHSDEYKVEILTPQLSRMSSDFIDNGYKLFINNKKRKSDGTLLAAKRKRRWTPKKHIEMKDASPPTGLCVKQETAEDDEGNFVCKKCGQRCTDMSDLRKHIADNHRLKGRYMICLECGENFVVAPSLQMHLKAFHGIENPNDYMNQNPSYAPNDSDLQTEGKTTVANQCYVCMAVFEDKAAVDKHLRVHGMAFLNHKRIEAKNALEKKINTEENKPSIKQELKETEKLDKPAETILEKINAAI